MLNFRLNLSAECERLKKGFSASVNGSEVTRTLSELKLLVKTPDWQKSSVWMVSLHDLFLIICLFANCCCPSSLYCPQCNEL